jgi:hypothetical protein
MQYYNKVHIATFYDIAHPDIPGVGPVSARLHDSEGRRKQGSSKKQMARAGSSIFDSHQSEKIIDAQSECSGAIRGPSIDT